MAPHPGYYGVADAFVGGLDSLVDGGFLRELVAVYQKGTCSVYGRRAAVRNLEKQVVDMIHEKPRAIGEFRRVFLRKSAQFLRFCRSIPNEPAALSDRSLLSWYEKYMKRYRDSYVYGEPVAWLIRNSLSGYLLDYIQTNSIRYDGMDENDILEVMTTEDRLPPIALEELEFISLAEKAKYRVKERDGVPGIFQGSLEEDVDIREYIADHTKKWRWLPCDYGSESWDEAYFFRKLAEVLARPTGAIHAKKSQLLRFSAKIRARQKEIVRKNRIDRYHRRLFEALRHAIFLFDRRKEEFAKAHLLLVPLLTEIFRRCGLEYEPGCYLLAGEVRNALKYGNLPDSEAVRTRLKSSVLHSVSPGAHHFLSSEDRDRILEEVCPAMEEAGVSIE